MSFFKKVTPASEAAEKALEADLAGAVASELSGKPKSLAERLAEADATVQAQRQQLERQRQVEMTQIKKLEAELQARLIRVREIDQRKRAAEASRRAKTAIAGIVAVSIGGMVSVFGGTKVHDETALAIQTLVQPWEGRSLPAYLDRIAKPPVWTICDGDTANVKPGMIETPEGCNRRTAGRMEREFRPALVACISNWSAKPLSWRAMMLSLSWNIGTKSACRSTAADLGRSGLYLQSCLAATAFNKAGGRVVIGLVKRREMGDATRIGEGELCVSGVAP